MKRSLKVRIGILVVFVVPLVISNVSASKLVLVTGFGPFGSYSTNPSQLIAESLNGTTISSADIIGVVLPVNFTTSVEKAIEAIERYHPDVVISLGLRAKSHVINIENIGVNLKRYQKENGRWSFPQRIDRNGPFVRFSSLLTKDIARRIQAADIPAKQSFSAGLYICNALFYGVVGYVHDQGLATSVGFIHVPLLDSQDPQGMPLETMVEAVGIAIQESLLDKTTLGLSGCVE